MDTNNTQNRWVCFPTDQECIRWNKILQKHGLKKTEFMREAINQYTTILESDKPFYLMSKL